MELLQKSIRENKVMYCKDEKCKGPVKPDIIFFGESLPEEFLTALNPDEMAKTDLLLVMGTALAVSPFNSIVRMVPKNVIKVLFNMENTDKTGGYDFTLTNENKLFV